MPLTPDRARNIAFVCQFIHVQLYPVITGSCPLYTYADVFQWQTSIVCRIILGKLLPTIGVTLNWGCLP